MEDRGMPVRGGRRGGALGSNIGHWTSSNLLVVVVLCPLFVIMGRTLSLLGSCRYIKKLV